MNRRARRPARSSLGALASPLLLLAVLLAFPASAAARAAPTPGAAAGPVSGQCGGAPLPLNVSGTLSVDGSRAPLPSVTNVSVLERYFVKVTYTPKGGNASTSCYEANATARTDSSGDFSFATSLPGSFCTAESCTSYAGPFGPRTFSPETGDPAGYFHTASVNGSTVALAYVSALEKVGLRPGGALTASVRAPVPVEAIALAGNGAPSPAALRFAWALSGVVWSLVSDGGGAKVVVNASAAGAGRLVSWGNGTYNGTDIDAPAASLSLSAVATTLLSGSALRSEIDVGEPALFSFEGSGAAGYTYTATVRPGLGTNATDAQCTSTPLVGGTVSVECEADVDYGGAGTAQPTASLTNGYSTATWQFPTVEVSDALALSVTPEPLDGYTGTTATVTVSPVDGTGTAPYGPACLLPPGGTLECGSAGSVLSINLTVPGLAYAEAWLGDATGANVSLTFPVESEPPPTLSPIDASAADLVIGGTVNLSASLAGGIAPIDYWWNATAPDGTVASGTLAESPAELTLAFSPTAVGMQSVTLTTRDRLGQVRSVGIVLGVAPGPAVALVAGSAAPGSVAAGEAIELSWTATDAAGGTVPGFALPLLLEVSGSAASAPLFVNASGTELLPMAPGSAYPLPAAAWSLGVLDLSVTPTRAGFLHLRLDSPLPVVGPGGSRATVTVLPDLQRLLLSHPISPPNDPAANDTRWEITDLFGNPLAGGFVIVRTVVDGATSERTSPILLSEGTSVVWVNYTAPASGSGLLFLLSEWGQSLLPPVPISSISPSPLSPAAWIPLAALGGLALALFARPRPRASREPPPAEVAEEELRRLAAARDAILARLAAGEATRETLLESGSGPGAGRAELAESLDALVAEGAVALRVGAAGAALYSLAPRRHWDAPHVELDARALEAALAQGSAPPEEEEP